MRVYELAKELGVTSGDVLRAAAQAGFEAETAISKIFDADIAPLTEALKGNYADVIELFRGKISAAALSSLQQNADRRDSNKISSEDGKASSANSGSTRRRK